MNDLAKDLLSCVDLEKLLLTIVLDKHIKPRLEELVANTENKFDDAALALALPVLEDALKDILSKLKE
jgi:hypothetical protein